MVELNPIDKITIRIKSRFMRLKDKQVTALGETLLLALISDAPSDTSSEQERAKKMAAASQRSKGGMIVTQQNIHAQNQLARLMQRNPIAQRERNKAPHPPFPVRQIILELGSIMGEENIKQNYNQIAAALTQLLSVARIEKSTDPKGRGPNQATIKTAAKGLADALIQALPSEEQKQQVREVLRRIAIVFGEHYVKESKKETPTTAAAVRSVNDRIGIVGSILNGTAYQINQALGKELAQTAGQYGRRPTHR
jgi:hypothetical protein